MTTLTIQSLSQTGLNPVFVAANAGGDKFLNTGKECLWIVNGGGAAITVTVVNQVPCSYGLLHGAHDVAVTVNPGAANQIMIGPFPAGRFNDSTGYANITYSNTASVTVAVIKHTNI